MLDVICENNLWPLKDSMEISWRAFWLSVAKEGGKRVGFVKLVAEVSVYVGLSQVANIDFTLLGVQSSSTQDRFGEPEITSTLRLYIWFYRSNDVVC